MIEQELPFRALDFERNLLLYGSRLLARAFAIEDEGERVPLAAGSKFRRGIPRHDIVGGFAEIAKNRMIPSAAEPVRGVSGIGLLTVQDGMPEAAFGRVQILNNLVSLVAAGKIEPQPG
jgi:hypothetical protein